MRWSVWLMAASVGCAAPKSSSPAAPDRDEAAASSPEDTVPDEDESASDAAAAPDLDFSEDVAAPSSTVSATPERRPSGSFNLCGDKCRDDTELEKSFDDDDDED